MFIADVKSIIFSTHIITRQEEEIFLVRKNKNNSEVFQRRE
jgi:hypothetical protein